MKFFTAKKDTDKKEEDKTESTNSKT